MTAPESIRAAIRAAAERARQAAEPIVTTALVLANAPANPPPDPEAETRRAARRARLTRLAILEAVGGKGKARIGAFPVLLEDPFADDHEAAPRLAAWDPAAYTWQMIVGYAFPVSWRSHLSDADIANCKAILAARVAELRQSGSGQAGTTRRRRRIDFGPLLDGPVGRGQEP